MAKIRRLDGSYSARVLPFSSQEWDRLCSRFSDLTVYQTWAYGAVRWGTANLTHFLLDRFGSTVAAAQVRLFRPPALPVGMAYVRYGPLWQNGADQERMNVFRQVIRAMRNEFVSKEGMVLRLVPNLTFADNPEPYLAILAEEGYRRAPFIPTHRTLLLDVRPPLEELRLNLLQRWRNRLNQAERRSQVTIVDGNSSLLYYHFETVYHQMVSRKKFVTFTDVRQFGAMQEALPEQLKLLLVVAYHEGRPVAGLVLSAVGQRAILLLAATNDEGREVRASYLAQWHTLRLLKERGCRWYDLGGIDPVTNPGGYLFKLGLAGKDGRDICYVGQFQCTPDHLRGAAVEVAEAVRVGYRRALLKLSQLRSQRALRRSGADSTERVPVVHASVSERKR